MSQGIELEKICRTCLNLNGPLVSMYDDRTDGRGGCIADMLGNFTKIMPTRLDCLPEKVCLSCISEITHCYSFKMRCENSYRTLRQLLPDAPEDIDDTLAVEKSDKSTQVAMLGRKDVKSAAIQTESLDNLSSNFVISKMDNKRRRTSVESFHNDIRKFPTQIKRKKGDCVEILNVETNSEITVKLNEDDILTFSGEEAYVEEQDSQEVYDENSSYSAISVNNNEYESRDVNTKKLDQIEDLNNTCQVIREDEVQFESGDLVYTADDDNVIEEYHSDSINYSIFKTERDETEIKEESFPQKFDVHKAREIKHKYDFKCKHCFMTFFSVKSLRRHLIKRHGLSVEDAEVDEVLNDGYNNKSVQPDDSVKQILKRTSNVTQDKLTTHVVSSKISESSKKKEVKLSFFCDRCKAGFALLKSLKIHRKLNACTVKPYECKQCKRVFMSQENLDEHMASDNHGVICIECNKVLESTEELSIHLINEHKRSSRNQCTICLKVFTMLSTLKDHMRIHSGEKPFKCHICDRCFSQNANLKQHIKRHSKEKKYNCDECHFKFVTKAELFSHKRTHTGDQPFKCNVCQSCFTTSSSLVKHKRIHTGERPYACDICPMRFSALNVLKNHVRTHTGEKPFKCIFCSKGFTQQGDCQIHQRTHMNLVRLKKDKSSTPSEINLTINESINNDDGKDQQYQITIVNVDDNEQNDFMDESHDIIEIPKRNSFRKSNKFTN